MLALMKALIRAGIWLDANNGANRKEAAQIISRPEYVGADYRVLSNSMRARSSTRAATSARRPTSTCSSATTRTTRTTAMPCGTLTQMRRWGQIPEAKPDEWYQRRGEEGESHGHLPAGREAARGRRQGEEGGLPVGQRRLRAPTQGLHRRHRVRRPQAERLHRQASRSA